MMLSQDELARPEAPPHVGVAWLTRKPREQHQGSEREKDAPEPDRRVDRGSSRRHATPL